MRFRSLRGFTLIELVVVVLILSVAFALVLPRLPNVTGAEKRTELRRLALSAQSLHEHAAFKKKALRSSMI